VAVTNDAGLLIARVLVEVPLPHLDRPFDYVVPPALLEQVTVGARVKVRFAGRRVGGYVLDLLDHSEHEGRLQPLAAVVSGEPVLDPAIASLARAVADRYAGTVADVLRLAIPRRHATVEREPGSTRPDPPGPPDPTAWSLYPAAAGFLAALAAGGAPRAVWQALPGADPFAAVAQAVGVAVAADRGALVVVPDAHDVERLQMALTQLLPPEQFAVITAALGPRERYRRWLAARRGQVRAVIGTRAAMFAPVHHLGLVVIWDDGDDLHAEPHAPYPHVREVLALRAHESDAAMLIGGVARTVEAQSLLSSGWAREIVASRDTVRAHAPRVHASEDDSRRAVDPAARAARLPTVVWERTRAALERGPVLFSVPRSGYLPGLACVRCRAAARCAACSGPLRLTSGHAVASCGWCGRLAGGWRCPDCGADRFRAQVVGAARTVEELGKAFPGVAVRSSAGDSVLTTVSDLAQIVVATPGAEPLAEQGYAAAMLLDAWALLHRPELRAEEETVRRWLNAAALVRPVTAGGEVVIVGDARIRAVQTVLRWAPEAIAEAALRERTALRFPPAARLAELVGSPEAVRDLLDRLDLPANAEVLGPVADDRRRTGGRDDAEPAVRALVRAPRGSALAMTRAIRAAQGERSAHKATDHVMVRVDPVDLS
jgi:primosomal protein N' (replication factor Y)